MGWDGAGPKLIASDIKVFEQKTGVQIPDALSWFLLNVINGGSPEPQIDLHVECAGVGNETILQGLYGISNAEQYYDLEWALGFDVVKRYLHTAFPIGYDPGDGQLVIATAGTHLGEVCYIPWEEVADPTSSFSLYPVTKDIRAFAELLVRENDSVTIQNDS